MTSTAGVRASPSLPTTQNSASTTSDVTAHKQWHRYTPSQESSVSLTATLSQPSSRAASHRYSNPSQDHTQWQKQRRPVRSQYPADSTEKHVEYILVASFDIDRGSVMEHQYPGPVGGDEHMLAELMLPDQTHLRQQDWTIFFLHKDADEETPRHKQRRKLRENGGDEENGYDDDDDDDEYLDGPPLVYVLNLVNTKQDNTVKRGAVVKAMAVCTRHPFLHIYKPLLLLALEQYFANPTVPTLANLYNAVNNMDISLMPRLSSFERSIMQSTEAKDLFLERFEAMVSQRMADTNGKPLPLTAPSPGAPSAGRGYGLPKDTHEFESVVHYANVPVPIKIPTALSPETVGNFSLVKLITTFSTPHATNPQPFSPLHPHLTTAGATTHPIMVLLNALLTQKRVIFLGHNLPSSEVAEAVLGACALTSGGLLRGFTRHAFPYTDLTKIDDLLQVPGFIAGVTNPAFAHKTEWWDVLCDLPTGRIRISNRIEAPPINEGTAFFQGAIGAANGSNGSGVNAAAGSDPTGDAAFMSSVLASIQERHGENAIRVKFRRWVVKFTSLAAAFEETVYGASSLQAHKDHSAYGSAENDLHPDVSGHGYVWPTQQAKIVELAANANRIEGWRNTRSYYNFIQDLASHYARQPVKSIDLQYLHDKLAKLRLTTEQSAHIYLAFASVVHTRAEISQLLSVVALGPSGLFFIAQGLFHPRLNVREETCALLERICDHDAGRYFWTALGRFIQMGFDRVKNTRDARTGDGSDKT
ncbi:protein mesa [Acrodontium crateriforme]|uniref:Protein mesa n=1 Tax=Acrodontium crateriforme TaxID=150365 RepID=A0AAQ3LYB8_9PEZI|nr:protein mesa [Acrodontium crateriforme]